MPRHPPSVQLVSRLLTKEYGVPEIGLGVKEPLDALIGVILSQQTTDTVSIPAYWALKKKYPDWRKAMNAPPSEIKKPIAKAGLANIKAVRIPMVLREIHKRTQGKMDLSFLGAMPDAEAKEWLTSLHGVGPKTAAVVLQFCFQKNFFPVDTHIHRVMGRLGYWNTGEHGTKSNGKVASREKSHELADALVPDTLKGTLHVQLIAHGRAVCTARNPHCDTCVLFDLCQWADKRKQKQRQLAAQA